MAKRYRVRLTVEEREALGHMISRGKADARKLAHARVLLQAVGLGLPRFGGQFVGYDLRLGHFGLHVGFIGYWRAVSQA